MVEDALKTGEWAEVDWKGGDVVMTRVPRCTAGLATVTGVIIQMHKDQVANFGAAAVTLAEALKAEGIDAKAEGGVGVKNDNNNAIHVLVGEKPK